MPRAIATWMLRAGLLMQAVCSISIILRLIRTSGGTTIARPTKNARPDDRVGVIIPVLNEESRIQSCLDAIKSLRSADPILVVDGGSSDATVRLARAFEGENERLQVIEAGPSPDDWNGKIWGLEHGLGCLPQDVNWVLTIDADVNVDSDLVGAMLETATSEHADLISVAARQRVRGLALSAVHPSMLTTLVYRFGIPGTLAGSVREVQANGQCFLVKRSVLERCGGFRAVRTSFCEDVTLARTVAASGYRVGFHEAGDLVSTEMYESAAEAWSGWSRSLPVRDRYFGLWGWWKLLEVLLAQGLAIPSLIVCASSKQCRKSAWKIVPLVIALMRIGTLTGTRRAYTDVAWSYWLSPLADLPVSIRILLATRQQTFIWRNQPLIRGE